MAALATQADFCYGEQLNMLQHALQAAHVARGDDEPTETVLACLLHDVGNTRAARDVWCRINSGQEEPPLLVSSKGVPIGYSRHAEMGATFLANAGFSDRVSGAAGLHV